MKLKYIMKNSDILTIRLNNTAFLENKHSLPCIVNNEEKKTLEILNDDSDKKYFVYNEEKKYIDDFEYIPFSQLIIFQKKGISFTDDEIFATFLKEHEKIGLLMNISIPKNNNEFEYIYTLMMLCFGKNYNENNWNDEISICPVFDAIKTITPRSTYYFSNLAAEIKKGNIKLVEKSELIDKLKIYQREYLKQIGKERENVFIRINSKIKRKIKKYPYKEKIVSVPAGSKNYEILLNYKGISFPISFV